MMETPVMWAFVDEFMILDGPGAGMVILVLPAVLDGKGSLCCNFFSLTVKQIECQLLNRVAVEPKEDQPLFDFVLRVDIDPCHPGCTCVM